MKKHLFLLVLATILALVLASCGGETAVEPTTAPDDTADTAVEEEAEPEDEPAEEAAEPVTLTYLVDDSQANNASAQALADAYMALHPNVTIIVESRPGGTEGDNIVKTRLATGEMTDVFWYNSGSLLQALNPTDTLVDLSNEPFIANIVESFLPTVSQDGQIFVVPSPTAMGGGILYNKRIFEELGLSVPTKAISINGIAGTGGLHN